ncbi:MAG: radical SAM protein [Planctomycetota bacterium]
MPAADDIVKETTSRCPVCMASVAATVVRRDGQVVMRKSCAAHGAFETVLAADGARYYPSHGAGAADGACCSAAPGCCAPPNPAATEPFERLSTCVALIEIVESCNLACPTCYAASPHGVGDDLLSTPSAEVRRRIAGVVARKGFIDIIQLSGGEPTLHPDFLEILAWCVSHPKIGYVLVNTNAVRVATDAEFRARLADLRRTRGKFELYVQFDGVQEAGQRSLRGADLRATRAQAIDAAGALGVPSTLAMTVTEETLPFLGDAMRFAVPRRHVRGISFQPRFTSGRIEVESSTLPIARSAARPLSVGDIVHALAAQAGEFVGPADFTPLPCGDPNCHTIGYLLRTESGTVPLSRLVSLEALQGFLANRVDYRLEDLAKCGCETEPLGEVLRALEASHGALGADAPFRMFIKPFMDAWTFDQDRVDRCCTHVIRPDGSLDSFCRYYLEGGEPAFRARTAATRAGARAADRIPFPHERAAPTDHARA